ncbi:MAG: DUF5684 domain-containing protein [Planctomycetaceae bacterium]
MLIGQLQLLAQITDDQAGAAAAGAAATAAAGVGIVMLLVYIALVVAIVVAQWKIFTKAGQPGWACIVPIYNIVVMLQICGRPTWWIAGFLLCPPVAVVFAIMLSIDLAKSFGKETGFAIGLILLPPIFMLMLGFGSAEYQGPAALAGGGGGAPGEG